VTKPSLVVSNEVCVPAGIAPPLGGSTMFCSPSMSTTTGSGTSEIADYALGAVDPRVLQGTREGIIGAPASRWRAVWVTYAAS